MNYLLCPANATEKLLVTILLVHIYYTVIFSFPFLLGGSVGYYIHPTLVTISTSEHIEGINYHFFLLLLFSIQSFYLFASIYFRKNTILKTLLFFTIASFVIFMILKYIGKYTVLGDFMVLVENEQVNNLISYGVYDGVCATDILSYTVSKYISYIWGYIAILFFWVLAYFRLRETEV